MDLLTLKKLLALTADPNPEIRKSARQDILNEWLAMNNALLEIRNTGKYMPLTPEMLKVLCIVENVLKGQTK